MKLRRLGWPMIALVAGCAHSSPSEPDGVLTLRLQNKTLVFVTILIDDEFSHDVAPLSSETLTGAAELGQVFEFSIPPVSDDIVSPPPIHCTFRERASTEFTRTVVWDGTSLRCLNW
ncbi:MAG TPA: hypothetical protein VM778_09415 [Gemmatimonadota bacterium]|nr:hypothetical protein [Gemmatimonadota bacterium]